MKKIKMPLIGIVATAMFAGIVSSVNVPFASVVYADTKAKDNTLDQTDVLKTEKIIKIEGSEVIVPKKGNKWVNLKGYWYFIKNGEITKGWKRLTKEDGESTEHFSYFDKETGRLYLGWHRMSEKEGEKIEHYSYFGPNGWLRTGWQKMGTVSNPDGNCEEHMSYFGDNGWIRTGWQKMGTKSNPDGNSQQHWSYFGGNGWLQTGWKKFTKKDGEKKEHWSCFGNNGWLKTGWFQESKGIQGLRYFDESGWLLGSLGHKTDWQKIGRVYYRFDEIGRINGANMPDYKINDQIANNFLGACGPTASFHAANATGGLISYENNLNGYKKFIWDVYGMPYGTDDKNSKGVYTTGTSLVNLSKFLKKKGVEAVYSPNRQYTTEEVKEAITHGQAIVPLMHVWYEGSKGSYFSQHYVAVTGWRQEGKSLQFFTADSYLNKNTGWTDVNKDGNKTSAYGYNKYTGYNATLKKAPAPRTGIGYSMKVGTYINF